MGRIIKVISERLGHSSIKTTLDTYATVMPKSRTNSVSILDELLKRNESLAKIKTSIDVI